MELGKACWFGMCLGCGRTEVQLRHVSPPIMEKCSHCGMKFPIRYGRRLSDGSIRRDDSLTDIIPPTPLGISRVSM